MATSIEERQKRQEGFKEFWREEWLVASALTLLGLFMVSFGLYALVSR